MKHWIIKRLVDLIFFGRLATSRGSCANRRYSTVRLGRFSLELTIRDTAEPDMYSREEVFRMLKTVRAEEARMNWTCPEDGPELWEEFLIDVAGRPTCGLCNNSGEVWLSGTDQVVRVTDSGYCICPNGRARKKAAQSGNWLALHRIASRKSERNGERCDCCDRGDEYNGFGSDGPLLFVCPKSCPCHD